MSTTTSSPTGIFSPPPPSPPESTPPNGPPDGQPKSTSLYLFTFLSTLFLLLVVSTAIVLRSFLLRRRYQMQLQEQFDEIFRPPGDTPGASRKRNFGAKPKLWDTWIRLDDLQNSPTGELADIKPLSIRYLPQETKPRNLSSTTRRSPSQERRHERSAAFLASLFANPLPRQRVFENDHPGDDSASPSTEIPRRVQVSVVISMPTPNNRKPNPSISGEEEFPNVAIGLTRLPTTNN
ncbi:hypothetical protein BJ322DRAFT_1212958 [Thelephora terrestris]|uniref:Uncharacterized protein n=1 Tax=Thelephora terrestris TaxID=56493 RepID=A0A9P6L3X9_9AGAM|nr:hypothetical protein BJ322DRAFT_1212958 [Thelephora terrestris]